MLSGYGSKARIIQAHMCPEHLRLQVRYSEFFDFRNLTKEEVDIFVRWFLCEPLAEHPKSSDEVASLVPAFVKKPYVYTKCFLKSRARRFTSRAANKANMEYSKQCGRRKFETDHGRAVHFTRFSVNETCRCFSGDAQAFRDGLVRAP